jgi:hypothetical protein
MMGPRQVEQGALFCEFSLEEHVPSDHLLRSIDRFVDLSELRQHLGGQARHNGRHPTASKHRISKNPQFRPLARHADEKPRPSAGGAATSLPRLLGAADDAAS